MQNLPEKDFHKFQGGTNEKLKNWRQQQHFFSNACRSRSIC